MDYAGVNWPVFPAYVDIEKKKKSHKSAKHSDGRKWGATTDINEILHNWAEWPDAMIGLRTGSVATGGSDLIVIDIDTLAGHDVDGVQNFKDLLAAAGKSLDDLPQTAYATTPTGGHHLYFRYPGYGARGLDGQPTIQFKRQLALGVDIQSDNQTIIAPPSYRPDKRGNYTWVRTPSEFGIAEMPHWLLEKCLQPSERAESEANTRINRRHEKASVGVPETSGTGDANDALVRVIARLGQARKGERNDTLYKCAYTLGGFLGAGYLNEEEVRDQLTQAALGIGLETLETVAAIENGIRAGKLKPLQPKVMTAKSSVSSIDLSHDALARDLGSAGFDENALFVPSWNKWVFWDQNKWLKDDQLKNLTLIRKYVSQRALDITALAELEAASLKRDAGDILLRWAKSEARKLKNLNTIKSIETLARANDGRVMPPDRFDANPFLLGTPDGTVDLTTGILRPAAQDELITKLTACGPADFEDVPKLWLKFLHRIFEGDQDTIDFIQRLAGYALTGSTKEHKLFFLHGGGRNGKSVFHNTLNKIWQDYSCDAPAELFMTSNFPQHPTGLAGLQGARLVIGSEIPKNATWNEAEIKKLTGGDRIPARYMRGDFFTYDPQLTLIIAGNDKPQLAGVNSAIRARLTLIPFNVQIPKEEQNLNLEAELAAEGPQILRWAIEGAVQWQRTGLRVPASILAASNAYLDDEDLIQNFIMEETITDPNLKSKTLDVYNRFKAWCIAGGSPAPKRKDFIREMATRGWTQTRQSSGYFFMGIGMI